MLNHTRLESFQRDCETHIAEGLKSDHGAAVGPPTKHLADARKKKTIIYFIGSYMFVGSDAGLQNFSDLAYDGHRLFLEIC